MRAPTVVRGLTDPLLELLRVPIMTGANRGCWWSLVSAGAGHGTGLRSAAQTRLIRGLLQPGDIMWDVGAHHGFMTLCAARRVGATGQVHAFEPAARNQRLLRRHVAWNGVRNVVIHPCALSSFSGSAGFGGTGTSRTWRLGGGAETVPVCTATELVAAGACPAPGFIKIDVEGAEADVIEGARPILTDRVRLLVAVHSREADSRCTALLRDLGFDLIPSRALELCRAGPWSSDPDLFCVGPAHPGRDRDRAVLRANRFER